MKDSIVRNLGTYVLVIASSVAWAAGAPDLAVIYMVGAVALALVRIGEELHTQGRQDGKGQADADR